MPEFQDLIEELKSAGVSIHAIEKLSQSVTLSDNWTTAFVEIAMTGRRIGVSLTRAIELTDERLDQILKVLDDGAIQFPFLGKLKKVTTN